MSPLFRGGLTAGGGSGGELIAESLLVADAATLSLSGLDLSGWSLVRVLLIGRAALATEGSGNWVRAMIQFNGDTGANYVWGVQNSDGTSVDNTAGGYINAIEAGHMPGPNLASSFWSCNQYDLIDPGASGKYKSFYTEAAYPTPTAALGTSGAGFWKNTAAITSILARCNDTTNILAGSRIVALGLAEA